MSAVLPLLYGYYACSTAKATVPYNERTAAEVAEAGVRAGRPGWALDLLQARGVMVT